MSILLAGCSLDITDLINKETTEDIAEVGVTLNVTTTWAGSDGGSETYQKYIKSYMEKSGNNINDFSGVVDEAFKERIQLDFEVGGESDVLFYFNGSDANAFIQAGKVVSLETIRQEYPEFGSNLDESRFVASEIDGKVYALPIYGYWEGLFVNKKVCEAAGVDVPDENTTWNEFMTICNVIKEKGYTPIAASLAKEPHYWFEFCIYNQLSPTTHHQIPESLDDYGGQAWQAGLNDLKEVYSMGLFPRNTLYTSSDQSFQSFLDGEAAFLIDGSWKIGAIISNAENVDDFTVTYVPGKGERKNTDIIGGFSSGWYITTKAWEEPSKRQAVVEFISHMTSDEAISDFASVSVSATTLKEGAEYDDSVLNQLQKDAVYMLDNITSISSAVQDNFSVECRGPLFNGMPNIVTERVAVEDAIEEFLELRQMEKNSGK